MVVYLAGCCFGLVRLGFGLMMGICCISGFSWVILVIYVVLIVLVLSVGWMLGMIAGCFGC